MKTKKKARSVPYDIKLHEDLRDPQAIGIFLSACMNGRSDEDFEVFWNALQTVAKAHGMTELAIKSGLSRDTFYKAFKGHQNPTVKSLRKILHALGLELAVVPRASLA